MDSFKSVVRWVAGLIVATMLGTLIAIHALRHSPDADRLEQILNEHATDPAILDEAVAIMDAAGSIEHARAYAAEIILAAKAELVEGLPKTRARGLLESMADFFVKRDN